MTATPFRALRDEAEPTLGDAVAALAGELRELRHAIAPDLAQRAAVLAALRRVLLMSGCFAE